MLEENVITLCEKRRNQHLLPDKTETQNIREFINSAEMEVSSRLKEGDNH